MTKKIIIKLSCLVTILVALNVLYKYTLFQNDLKTKSPEALAIKSQDLPDVYFFGESSNATYRDSDSIKSSITELASMFFPTIKIVPIVKPATHAGIYKSWARMIDLKKNKTKALIITLNLRSFDAAWIHSKLETQLQESMVLTQDHPPLLNRFQLSLQAFDNKTEKQREQMMLEQWKNTPLLFPFAFPFKSTADWDYAMAQGHYKKSDGTWDKEKNILACHYIKAYAFNLNDQNPRVKDFDEIVMYCAKNRINLYLNLMAENIDYADSLVGKELVFLMKQNRDFIVKRYSKRTCVVIDNLDLVRGKDFIDQNWTTEHYAYKGRMAIAKNLALNLKKQFVKEYKDAY